MTDTATAPTSAPSRPTIDELLATCGPYITLLADRLARQFEVDHEDARQELVVVLVASHPRYDPARGAMTTWVAMRYRWLACDWSRRRRPPVADVDVADVLDLADHAAVDPAEVLAESEDRERLREALAGLRPATREIVGRRFGMVEGDGRFRTLAGELGVTKEAARQRERVGLRMLAEALGADPDGVTPTAKTRTRRRGLRVNTATPA